VAGPFGKDKICAVAAAPDARGMMQQIARALRYTRTVELRLDWLASTGEFRKFLAAFRSRRPRGTFIATLRRRAAGGKSRESMPSQLARLRQAIEAGCLWCDVEIETADSVGENRLDAALGKARRIISSHKLKGTPATKPLNALVRHADKFRGDATKIATLSHSLADAWRILALARKRRDVVAVPMGEFGVAARILALREGSALAYAPVEEATAPGQVSLAELKTLYRADKLTRRTRVYGVIGNPVHHSLSPQLQNAGFQARRMDAVYVPFLVRELKDFLAAIEPLGIAGFSVTLPHKEKILAHLDDCDPLAQEIGAVNTVVVRGGGKLYGYNTDYVGVLRALESRIPLQGSSVLILGAGGAARAVAVALVHAGAYVRICARRENRARALARHVGGEAIPRRRIRGEFFDAIVNATPVGMFPRPLESPLAAAELNCRLVFDLIYRPLQTKLMQLARGRGIETVSGLEMFVAQGTAQWEIWTGERAPVAAMRAAVEKALRREELSR